MMKIKQKEYSDLKIDLVEKNIVAIIAIESLVSFPVYIERENLPRLIELLQAEEKKES